MLWKSRKQAAKQAALEQKTFEEMHREAYDSRQHFEAIRQRMERILGKHVTEQEAKDALSTGSH